MAYIICPKCRRPHYGPGELCKECREFNRVTYGDTTCANCNGTGKDPKTYRTCTVCNGKGRH